MESPINLEKLESIAGLPLTNDSSSPTSADAPLYLLLGKQFHEMTPEEAGQLVQELRHLRKNPQAMSAKLIEGTETKKPKRAPTVAKAQGANMANSYVAAMLAKKSGQSTVPTATPTTTLQSTEKSAASNVSASSKSEHKDGNQPNLL